MKSLLVASLLFLMFSACAPVSRLPIDVSEQTKAFLAFRIDSVMFIDNRSDTLTTEMNLPIFATRQRTWKISPVLAPELREELRTIVQASSNPEGIPTLLTVTIEQGYYMVSGNASQVGEHTRFNCILLFDVNEEPGDFKTFAHANFDLVGAFNATEKHAREIYRITARTGVFTALKKAEKVFD